jgi:hypothetical protein
MVDERLGMDADRARSGRRSGRQARQHHCREGGDHEHAEPPDHPDTIGSER